MPKYEEYLLNFFSVLFNKSQTTVQWFPCSLISDSRIYMIIIGSVKGLLYRVHSLMYVHSFFYVLRHNEAGCNWGHCIENELLKGLTRAVWLRPPIAWINHVAFPRLLWQSISWRINGSWCASWHWVSKMNKTLPGVF